MDGVNIFRKYSEGVPYVDYRLEIINVCFLHFLEGGRVRKFKFLITVSIIRENLMFYIKDQLTLDLELWQGVPS